MQSEWRERLGRQVNDKLTKGSHQRERERERGRRRSGGYQREHRGAEQGLRMEDGFSSYSSLYDTSSLLQFCNGKTNFIFPPSSPLLPSATCSFCGLDMSPADWLNLTPSRGVCMCACVSVCLCCRHELFLPQLLWLW